MVPHPSARIVALAQMCCARFFEMPGISAVHPQIAIKQIARKGFSPRLPVVRLDFSPKPPRGVHAEAPSIKEEQWKTLKSCYPATHST
jgi:hypothetical protein